MLIQTLNGLVVNEVGSGSMRGERENCRAVHLLELKESFNVQCFEVNELTSCCSWMEQWGSEMACRSLVSSANSRVVNKGVAIGRILMYMEIKNCRDPRALLCTRSSRVYWE